MKRKKKKQSLSNQDLMILAQILIGLIQIVEALLLYLLGRE